MKRFYTSKVIFFLLLILSYTKGYSQIQGTVKNTNNESLPFANVLLLNEADSSLVKGIISHDDGSYTFNIFTQGRYIIQASMLGYTLDYSSPFKIEKETEHHHNEAIILQPYEHQLQDVNIIAKKPIYELQIDRMVVNVENSITSAGNNALEVLEKSPGVIVSRQNNTISLAGKDGVMIMINGKVNRMPMAAAVQLLESMNADNVKKIELITTPPSKYEAEGNAGIINVVLKKNEAIGTNGSVTLGAAMGRKERGNGSINLNHHKNRINFFGLYSTKYNNFVQTIGSNRTVNQNESILKTNSSSNRDAINLFQSARLGFDYTVNSKINLGLLFTGYIRTWDMTANNAIKYQRDADLAYTSDFYTNEGDKWKHGMGNFNFQYIFNDDEQLDFNVDFLIYDNNNISSYEAEGHEEYSAIDARKSSPIELIVGKLDYTKKFSDKLKFETGVKANNTNFTNDVSISFQQDDIWTIDKDLTNIFYLKENVSAGYASFNYQINKKHSLIAGMRYEYLNSVLSSISEEAIVDLHYGELFPTLYYSNKLNETNTLQFSYSKRINRPTFNELAPFILFLTPETFVAGNENLLPAISHIVKTEFQHNRLILSLSYTNTKNSISRFQPRIDEEKNRLYYLSSNLDLTHSFSAMISLPITVNDWWSMQNNLNGAYKDLSANYQGIDLSLKQGYYQFNSSQNFQITDRFTAELSGFYRSKALAGIYTMEPFGQVNAGLQMKFKNTSILSLNVSDIFRTSIYSTSGYVEELNIDINTRLDFDQRVFRVTYSYNFGNSKFTTKKRKTASEEERGRISN